MIDCGLYIVLHSCKHERYEQNLLFIGFGLSFWWWKLQPEKVPERWLPAAARDFGETFP